MPLPLALTVAYLVANLAVMVWLELERANGRAPTGRTATFAHTLRWGPPLAGLIYLVAIAGDWLFFLFVIAFFAASFWLMDGLVAFTSPTRKPDAMHRGWDDRVRSNTDREAG